ncbi:MAG: 2'-5' RNA ligase family protein [Cyanobacteria bacterium P01_A01_bin.114]
MASNLEANTDAGKQLRFFIALVPPQPIQDYANQVKQYFAQRYNSRKALNSPPHITLQPPFDWPVARLPEICEGMALFAETQPDFGVAIAGFAAFPPQVIYMNVVHSAELAATKLALMDFMETRFGILNLKERNRPFKPHLTVAFRDLKPATFRQAWPEFQDKAVYFQFMARYLTLLQHNGQRWIIQSQYALA